jgi:alginate O-acetyltransferase complex protein AlgI
MPASDLGARIAWFGTICYTFQIYFDFSGYSDMAIGLGRMFGFRFLENFNYPYISKSIREFWRRWHISLSTWFRDYLYISLGGNRKGAARTYANLVTVFVLCGLWHGAAWTFVVWGLYHGVFLVLERTAFGKVLANAWTPLRYAYALLVVIVGWVFFRAETFAGAWAMLTAMAGFAPNAGNPVTVARHLDPMVALALIVGVVASTPLGTIVTRRWFERPAITRIAAAGEVVVLSALFLLSSMLLSAQTHNPFIYFRF